MEFKINDSVFDQFPVLETERLILRSFRLEDAPQVYEVNSNAEVLRYMDKPALKDLDEAKEKITKLLGYFENKESITWAIQFKDNPNFIGDVGIWNLDRKNMRGEIGYALHPNQWRKGIMKEALSVVLRYGFTTMNLHSIKGNVNTENIGSQKLLESCGFKLEAHFREDYFYDGKFLDSLIFSLLESDLD